MTKNVILEIKNLKKSYGQNQVLKDISISVEKGEVISIIGSSGSGNQPSSDLSTFGNTNRRTDSIPRTRCFG